MKINLTIDPETCKQTIDTHLLIESPLTNQTILIPVVYHPDRTTIPSDKPSLPSLGLSMSDIILIMIALVVFFALVYSMKSPAPIQPAAAPYGAINTSSRFGSEYGTPAMQTRGKNLKLS